MTRVAIIGGTNYGALAAITSALESLPPGASLVLSSNVGVCVFAASEAMRLEIPATTVYWKHEIHRLLPLADLFLVFFDGTNNYVQRVLRRLAAESRRTRLFLPTGREVANPFAPAAIPCATRAGESTDGLGNKAVHVAAVAVAPAAASVGGCAAGDRGPACSADQRPPFRDAPRHDRRALRIASCGGAHPR